MVINLALLLILYGERAADITILCAYLGQTAFVRKKIKSYQAQYPQLLPSNAEESIVVNTVDMYQVIVFCTKLFKTITKIIYYRVMKTRW